MSFFRRKEKNLIPPVPEAGSRDDHSKLRKANSTSPMPAYRAPSASTYVPSRDGNLYGSKSASASPSPSPAPTNESGGRYTRQNGVGDVYSRGHANLDKDRGELFSGFNPEKSTGRFFNESPGAGTQNGGDPASGQGEDDDVEGIKQQLRFTKQESVNSTRNALRLAREAEENARLTSAKLGDQSEKLASTERHLDVSKGYSRRAEDRTDELKQLNRSIFRPVITFNKEAKRQAQEDEIQRRFDEERDEREKGMLEIRQTQDRLGRAAAVGEGSGSGRMRTATEQDIRKEQRKRFQFEATASDDEMEDEIDDNLDEISSVTKRLKALGTAMGDELDKQNERIGRITEKTDGLDNRLFVNTQRLNRIR